MSSFTILQSSLHINVLTWIAEVVIVVHPPSVLILYGGVGRLRLINANVALSTIPPHSILIIWLVRIVNLALPTDTTESGFGAGSYPAATSTDTQNISTEYIVRQIASMQQSR